MKFKRIYALLLVFLFPLLMGSRCGDTKIQGGTARDTIFSVEHHYSGAVSLWLTNDDVVGYCTTDPKLIAQLDGLIDHNGEIIITYRDINASDDEVDDFSSSECGTLGSSESTTDVVKLLTVEPVQHRAGVGR